MELFEIKIEVPPASADAIDGVLLELGDGGWSLLEDVITKQAWVTGIFQGADEARARWAELRALLPADAAPLGAPVERALGDRDWRDSYKAHFKAWRFGRLHWVPVWERGAHALPDGDAVIWLDPGLAFGTGNHETTRLCVERLAGLGVGPATRVADAGCGSGILALSAARLGCGRVIGFDNDPEAVRVSEENAALNGLAGRVEFATGDLVSGFQGQQWDIVLANILAGVLIQFARELAAAVAPGGALVLSGILASENAQVRKAFAAVAPGWQLDWREMGEWSDVLLRRPA
ncbi:MAG: 50S ribosomal protein L11 methyltransferase [Opitutaceae bacterium]|jgi:ribosomal protein L11 methyltransferase|nr:50S ribosomal protein L11 methyltransferase [Opitutaceae bacterium]